MRMKPPLPKTALGGLLWLACLGPTGPAQAAPARAPAPATPTFTPPTPPRPVTVDPRDRLSLPQLFDLIKTESPRYRALQSEVDVAKAETRAARVLPNPVLNLAILYLNSGFNQNGVATYYANATFPLLVGGQRRFRVKSANAFTRATEAEVVADYQNLAEEARNIFVELQAAQARTEVYDEALVELGSLKSFVEERRTAGFESEYATLRVAMRVSAWNVRRIDSVTQREEAAARLGAMVGRPTWRPHAEGSFAPTGVEAHADAMWAETQRTQPEITAARMREAHAVQNVALARREAVPVPNLTAGTVVIQNYFSASTTIGVTMPIPVFDWGQGLKARAEAQVISSRREREAITAEVQAELTRAVHLLKMRRDALADYEREILGKSDRMRTLALEAFRAGQAEVDDLVIASETHHDVRIIHIDLKAAVMQAEVDVLAAAGRIEEVR
jgi:cobalt-zinc-cadmium efflux system outer membrane protein